MLVWNRTLKQSHQFQKLRSVGRSLLVSFAFRLSLELNFYKIQMTSAQQIQIAADFRQTCLIHIQAKIKGLQDLKKQSCNRLQEQATQAIDELSKALIILQDSIVKHFRTTAKIVFEHQSQIIQKNLVEAKQILYQKLKLTQYQLVEYQNILLLNKEKSKKLMAKFAKGKLQQHYCMLQKELQSLQFQRRNYIFNEQELKQQVQDIMQLLISIPQLIMQKNCSQQLGQYQSINDSYMTKSILSLKNISNPNLSSMSYFSHKSYIINNNRSSVTIQHEKIQEKPQISEQKMSQYSGTSAIDDFRELKSIKKKNRLEVEAQKTINSEASTMTNLAKLILARQKLLREIEQ